MATTPLKVYRKEEFRSGIRIKPSTTEPAVATSQEGDIIFHASKGLGQFLAGVWVYGQTIVAAAAMAGIISISTANGVATISIAKATTTQDGLMAASDKVDLDTAKADIDGLKTRANTVESDVATAKADIVTAKADIASIKPDLAATKAAVDAATNAVSPGKIVKYDANGNFQVAAPQTIFDAVNEGYVNDRVAALEAMIDGTLKTPEAFVPAGSYPSLYNSGTIQKGDSFRIVSAGVMGGKSVNPEDLLIALVDNPSPSNDSDWQIVESNRTDATPNVKGFVALASKAEVEAKADANKAVVAADLEKFVLAKSFQIVGDGSATEFSFTHGFNRRNVAVVSKEAQSPFADVSLDAQSIDANTVKFVFDEVLPSGYAIDIELSSK